MKKTRAILMIGAVFLAGCSTMNSEFSCKATANDRCLTIEQVDAMTQYANEHDTDFKPRARKRKSALPAPVYHTQRLYKASKGSHTPSWVAPFIDKSGKAHSEAMLYPEPHQPRARG